MASMKTRISTYYRLGRTQPTVDFVDVDIQGDTRVFVDPRALRLIPSEWGSRCVSLVQSFFRSVLTAIRAKDDHMGQRLLGCLHEPNETHLGLSKGSARGRALGPRLARDVWKALRDSEAAKRGLLEDLEDITLMIEGISNDIISDITTNIIRQSLIEYTQAMCSYYGIPMESEVDSGPIWDSNSQAWRNALIPLPVTSYGKLLLVPKAIVRRRMEYDDQEYYRDYILPYLVEQELSANTELVRLLRDGRRKVTKKDVKAKYGAGKEMVLRQTLQHPNILTDYRLVKRQHPRKPLSHVDLADSEIGGEEPLWNDLLKAVVDLPVGADSASDYEDKIEQLLTALFYPTLTNPIVQHEIHGGRKRIDITYTNLAVEGFFRWVAQHYTAPHIFVECKNYGKEVGNPELDQLSGRFSPSRGRVGLLVCRSFTNKKLFLKRCHDTARDDRGFVIALDDSDLKEHVTARQRDDRRLSFAYLKARFDQLIM